MNARSPYAGPAFLSFGFRPFFLAASVFAMLSIPLWLLIWRGDLAYLGYMVATDWHIHEMIFGYGSAVVAGFLFTAVPNWTGRMPARGWPLAALLTLWTIGRLAMAGWLALPPLAVMGVDGLFLIAVIAMIAREIIAGRNWRNLKVLLPVTLLGVSNLCFHVEAMTNGVADTSRRFGIAVLIFLIMLIGGRIIPSFTRNWLARTDARRMPVPFGRFDAVCLGIGALSLLAWSAAPETPISGILLLLAGGMHALRLMRWRGLASLPEPLLFMLHVAYALVPAGLLAAAAVPFGLLEPAAPVHILGIGAIGGMTLAVMIRATMGHSGRPLRAGPMLTLSFGLILAATAMRFLGAAPLALGWDGTTAAACLWSVGFALVLAKIGPWLVSPKTARKQVSTPQSQTPYRKT